MHAISESFNNTLKMATVTAYNLVFFPLTKKPDEIP
jgi:hypothetical protein